MRKALIRVVWAVVTVSTAFVPSAQATTAPSTTMVGKGGVLPSITPDGRRIAFFSAYALVPGDTNGGHDLYVFDRSTGSVTRASVSSTGAQADRGVVPLSNGVAGYSPNAISEDGNVVAFVSESTTLSPSRSTESLVLQRDVDVFVRDLRSGTTREVLVDRLSPAMSAIAVELSANGRFVAWETYSGRVWLHDLATGLTTGASVNSAGQPANDWAYAPSVSRDGRFVAFVSAATNLAPGVGYYNPGVFVRDMINRTTRLVSTSPTGQPGNDASYSPTISADGTSVVFPSYASNLTTDHLGPSRAAHTGVFVHDLGSGITTLASVSSSGQGADGAFNPAISADGRYVTFASGARNVVKNDTNNAEDIFLHDRSTGTTTRVSVSSGGAEPNGNSGQSAVSGDGKVVPFDSRASNLVPQDTNGDGFDVFVRHL